MGRTSRTLVGAMGSFEVVAFELEVGGEHSAWWMKCAWSPAVEVDVTLAAMDVVGRGVLLWLMVDCRVVEVSSTVP